MESNTFNEMLEQMKHGQGFIAALDQSGGSTPKALANYGISAINYTGEAEMFRLIHQMRTRVITSPAFTNQYIIGAILFERTMNSRIGSRYTAEYLWQEKHIVPFLKVDDGLAMQSDGVQLMKPIPELTHRLDEARRHPILGTKMRSLIHMANPTGIKAIVDQQFQLARQISQTGLVPIIEPEVSINAPDKDRCEQLLLDEITAQLEQWGKAPVIFKLTIPSQANFYADLYRFDSVVRVVALSGGYNVNEACIKLMLNHNMPASFSRALLQNLREQQSDAQFNATLSQAISQIYQASIT